MISRRTASLALASLLVVATLPFYFFVFTVALNFFDPPADATGWTPWAGASVIIVLAIAVPLVSLFTSIQSIRKQHLVRGLVISLVPTLCLSVLWLWLMQQSFS
jgi:hypothetical protein